MKICYELLSATTPLVKSAMVNAIFFDVCLHVIIVHFALCLAMGASAFSGEKQL